jgi:GntR family transcriptional regulator
LSNTAAPFFISSRCVLAISVSRTSNSGSRASEVSGMPVKQHSAIPAYQRIQSSIRKRIDAGQLRPGDPVTSERDLAKLHEVSLMTARHALAYLEREGIVERRRGIGTFVAEPKIHFNKLMSYTEQMAGRSLVAASKILFGELIDDEPDVAARLSLAPTEPIIKLERLRHASEEPFALETCYVSAAQFPELLSAPLHRDSLFAILERDYGVKLGYADEEIDATAADPKTSELLDVPRREPLLRIRQLIYSTSGKPLMYVLGIYRSDRHNFVIRRYR